MLPIRVIIDEADNVRARYAGAVKDLGERGARRAMVRAVNRVGHTAAIRVRRALVAQTSVPRAVVNAAVKERQARADGVGGLDFVVYSTGKEIPLKEFGARQFSKGVRAKVWGRFQTYPRTFIVPRFGGHVFHRIGRSRLPIKKVYGPSIPKEMVKDQSLAAFEGSLSDLEARLVHEIGRLLPGTK